MPHRVVAHRYFHCSTGLVMGPQFVALCRHIGRLTKTFNDNNNNNGGAGPWV